MGPKWDPNGTQMEPKWDPNGTQMGPKWEPRLKKIFDTQINKLISGPRQQAPTQAIRLNIFFCLSEFGVDLLGSALKVFF